MNTLQIYALKSSFANHYFYHISAKLSPTNSLKSRSMQLNLRSKLGGGLEFLHLGLRGFLCCHTCFYACAGM
jgi:hypothetical protein